MKHMSVVQMLNLSPVLSLAIKMGKELLVIWWFGQIPTKLSILTLSTIWPFFQVYIYILVLNTIRTVLICKNHSWLFPPIAFPKQHIFWPCFYYLLGFIAMLGTCLGAEEASSYSQVYPRQIYWCIPQDKYKNVKGRWMTLKCNRRTVHQKATDNQGSLMHDPKGLRTHI